MTRKERMLRAIREAPEIGRAFIIANHCSLFWIGNEFGAEPFCVDICYAAGLTIMEGDCIGAVNDAQPDTESRRSAVLAWIEANVHD